MTTTMRNKILARAARNVRRRDKIMTDVNAESNEVQRDSEGYIVGSDVLTFTVPKNTTLEGASAGTEIDFPFTYREVENLEQANKVIADKGWDLVELVNRKLKGDARASVYQRESNRHKPVTLNVPVEDVKQRIAKDIQRVALSRGETMTFDDAMKQVEQLMGQNNG